MMNEDFYQMYKAGRDLVKEFYGKRPIKYVLILSTPKKL